MVLVRSNKSNLLYFFTCELQFALQSYLIKYVTKMDELLLLYQLLCNLRKFTRVKVARNIVRIYSKTCRKFIENCLLIKSMIGSIFYSVAL
ncbi:hypothetical protein L596_014498 [Steinernema carpocapsae]|uniref:Uncharacterized protein n=1 Tax=Steinernema carpocapsae TaxID=34508 RepID=A0A4U5NCN0_STECR|nr:hypothetical protein L596_014498 [Steinernema carpocapsae]